MRKPNTACSNCGKPIYRRPSQMKVQNNVFCSHECQIEHQGHHIVELKVCAYEGCETRFKPEKKTSKYCSRTCANKARRGSTYKKGGFNNKSAARLTLFLTVCKSITCAVEGCDYSTTYDMHRIIPGRKGGTYEIGNMYAICPNHHAEVERGLISLIKVDDCTLKAVSTGG